MKHIKTGNKHIGHSYRKIAVLTALAVAGASAVGAPAGTVYAAEKEETVYVKADADGAAKSVIVSDWLKNTEGSATVDDASELQGIENVKGKESYTAKSDGSLVWQADGNDIYYQGTTDKQVPVDVKITYMLDGKEMSAKEIVGKSGKVTIRFDYTNRAKEKVSVGGKEENVTVPFTVLTGMMLPTDSFSNVTVDNGRCISEGSRNIIVGYAFPGVSESLDIDSSLLKEKADEITIPESMTITADTTDFEMGTTMTFVSDGFLGDQDLSEMFDFNSLESSIDELGKASGKLKEGSGELNSGIITLQNSFSKYQAGESQLRKGIEQSKNGVDQLDGGSNDLKKGTKDLSDGAGTLASGAQTLSQGTKDLQAGAEKSAAGAAELSTGAKGLNEGVQALASGIEGMYATVSSAMADYEAGANAEPAAEQAYAQAMAALQAAAGDVNTKATAMAQAGAQAGATQDPADQAAFASAQQAYAQSMAALQAAAENANVAAQALAQASGAKGAYEALSSVKSGIDAQGLMGEGGKLAQLKAGASGLADGADALSSGTEALAAGSKSVTAGAQNVADGASKVADGAGKVAGGSETLANGVSALKAGSDQLAGGAAALDDGAGQLAAGIAKLAAGSDELAKGMTQFDEEGIGRLEDVFGKDVPRLTDRIRAMQKAAESYTTFSGLSEGAKGSVKFIIETEEVRK